jgi:hypothetical protein
VMLMPRECTVCAHEDSFVINEALVVQKVANRRIAAQYDLSEQSIRRHRQHIPQMLAQASRAEEVAQADSLLDRLEDLQRRTEAVLEEVEVTDNYLATLGAIREMRRNLELIGEVTKELDRQPTINLSLNPEYLELRSAILVALEPHPEAAESVSRAMLEIENGSR